MFYVDSSDFTIRIKTKWERQVLRFRSEEAALNYVQILRECGLRQTRRSL